jgi:DNA-binding Lrp family transcriptional regulator
VVLLDFIDKGILLDLGDNCRVPFEALARKYGVSATAIKKRVANLIDAGVIERFLIELRLAMIDADLVLALVQTDGTVVDEDFTESVAENQDVYAILPLATGDYVLLAQCVGPEGLSELGSFVRVIDGVQNVELHPVLIAKGKKTELSSLQLRVLACLAKDARMSTPKIASHTGLTARRVRRILQELQEGDAIHFKIIRNLNVGANLAFLARITWNPSDTNQEALELLLKDRYPVEYWFSLPSAVAPLAMSLFVVDHIKDVERILRELKGVPGVIQVMTHLFFPGKLFPAPTRRSLEDLVADIKLQP